MRVCVCSPDLAALATSLFLHAPYRNIVAVADLLTAVDLKKIVERVYVAESESKVRSCDDTVCTHTYT